MIEEEKPPTMMAKPVKKLTAEPSQLDQPMWAVIDAVNVQSTDLTYSEATELVGMLNPKKGAQPCIVTNDVAKKMLEKSRL